jgi:hypothetical protein
MDENGQVYENYVWTGTSPGGTNSSRTCFNWASYSVQEYGDAGRSGANDSGWTIQNSAVHCGSLFSLYCIEK